MSGEPPDEPVPDDLHRAIARDLTPVRPLAPPWRRAAVLLPLAIAVVAGIPWVMGVRHDAGVLGAWWSWGVSSLQLLAGFVLVGLALRESVPGSALSPRQLAGAIASGVAIVAAVTWATYAVSPTSAPPARTVPFFVYCLRHSALLGAPAVIAAGLLAARAFPLRPWVAGALYGLGGGLMTDAGWRLFCDVSAPSHVLMAHGGAMLVLVVLGMLTASAGEWVRARLARRPPGTADDDRAPR
jgi:hypothetical protein